MTSNISVIEMSNVGGGGVESFLKRLSKTAKCDFRLFLKHVAPPKKRKRDDVAAALTTAPTELA